MPSLETNQLLAAAVDAADSRKAEDIRILALDPSESALTDYFLICNGTNERQNAAIADEIEGRLKREFATHPNSTEGRRQGEWILMDYVDFVVHIFMPEKREYYGLERLRKSATTLTAKDLNAEVEKAIAATRKKNSPPGLGNAPAKRAAAKKTTSTDSAIEPKQGGKTGRKSSSRIAVAIAQDKPAKKPTTKKSAAEKSAAKKSAPRRNVTPQPVSRAKSGAKTSASKKSAAKKPKSD